MGNTRIVREYTDLAVIFSLVTVACLIWAGFDIKPLWGGMLVTLLPSLYLGLRRSKPWLTILTASIFLGLFLGGTFDLIQSYNGAWSVDRTVVPFQVFGIMPFDNALGYFLMTLFTLTFYEHFFGQPKRRISKRLQLGCIAILILTSTITTVFAMYRELFDIPYAYTIGGTLAVVTVSIGILRHQELLNSTLRTAVFFFFVWFATELAAVVTGGWTYPSDEYIGYVTVFSVSFPLEELLFWMMWYAPFLVVAYEYLLRDKDAL